ncbi:MAG: proline dehydrogenase family protein [Bacteroidales bacterium]|nr:proline dehydrogenase family protein [Bacteroidales bacterium]
MNDQNNGITPANMDFTDTQHTFAHKSTRELKKSAWLFQLMARPRLVKWGNAVAMYAAKAGLPVAWAVKPTLYQQFVGGETLEECKKTIENLASRNISSILDYAVEANETRTDFNKIMKETSASIQFSGNHAAVPFAVVKPTAIAHTKTLEKAAAKGKLTPDEALQHHEFTQRMEQLAMTAVEHNTLLLIDAEDYAYQDAIDEIVINLMRRFNREKAILFNTWQMYRTDRLNHLKNSIETGRKANFKVGVKLVRGAYMEKERECAKMKGYPSPIHPDKEKTDMAYNRALELCMENLNQVAVFNGTHNEISTVYLAQLIKNAGLPKNHPSVWFAQLYGMSDPITARLAKEGFNVAKYVPYGPVKEVLPYLSRRAIENTSVKGQTGRELQQIKSELARRKAIGALKK